MLTVYQTVAVWSCGIILPLALAFASLVALSSRIRRSDFIRHSTLLALWLAAATLICHVLYTRADAQAAIVHQRNVGMALVYFYFWILAAIPSPILGFAIARWTFKIR